MLCSGGRTEEGGPVGGQAGSGFGGLLRQLRIAAGLTQEELAGAAQVSPSGQASGHIPAAACT